MTSPQRCWDDVWKPQSYCIVTRMIRRRLGKTMRTTGKPTNPRNSRNRLMRGNGWVRGSGERKNHKPANVEGSACGVVGLCRLELYAIWLSMPFLHSFQGVPIHLRVSRLALPHSLATIHLIIYVKVQTQPFCITEAQFLDAAVPLWRALSS